MMFFDWNEEKNLFLKQQRGVSFEDVVIAFENDKVLDIIDHHNPDKYPNQKLFVIELNDYIYYVPFVKNVDRYFLKNIIPSRKLYNLYKKGSIMNYSEDEIVLLNEIESGQFNRIDNFDIELMQAKIAAKNTITQNQNINISISEADASKLKAKSIELGIPYQIIVNALIHNYITGKLKLEITTLPNNATTLICGNSI